MVDTNFKTKFLEINKRKAAVIIQHIIFGKERYDVDDLCTFCDDKNIGVIIKNQQLYIPVNEITTCSNDQNIFEIYSFKKKIQIILKK